MKQINITNLLTWLVVFMFWILVFKYKVVFFGLLIAMIIMLLIIRKELE